MHAEPYKQFSPIGLHSMAKRPIKLRIRITGRFVKKIRDLAKARTSQLFLGRSSRDEASMCHSSNLGRRSFSYCPNPQQVSRCQVCCEKRRTFSKSRAIKHQWRRVNRIVKN